MNELTYAIENMFDDFTIHPSGAYVISHMGDEALVILEDDKKSRVLFGTRARISGTHAEIANVLRDWRNRPQL